MCRVKKVKENDIITQMIIKEEKSKLDEIMVLNNDIASLRHKLEKMEQANLNNFSAIGNLFFFVILINNYFR